MKKMALKGKPISDGKTPLICAPLVARIHDDLIAETRRVAAKRPDILEWRVDFFGAIASLGDVVRAAAAVRHAASGIPILFTCRSVREGGTPVSLPDQDIVRLYEGICESGCVDLIDYEISNDPGNVQRLREFSRARGVQMIMSFHNFHYTPGLEFLNQKFLQAEQLGADVAKVAVMPRDMQDVLTLLQSTLQSSRKLRIPVVSMSMGGEGCLSRMCGWAFGSAMTFAVGASSSAPGQMPIEDVNVGIALIQKASGR